LVYVQKLYLIVKDLQEENLNVKENLMRILKKRKKEKRKKEKCDNKYYKNLNYNISINE